MYKLSPVPDFVIRLSDNAQIPVEPENTDYQKYTQWLDEGNTPLPCEPAP